MHGRNRREYNLKMSDSAVVSALTKKVSNLQTLKAALIARRKSSSSSSSSDVAETMGYLNTLLPINPDYYSLWNYRKELILSSSPAFPSTLFTSELKLTEMCLRKNPKCYSAWHHRKWSICQFLSSTSPPPTPSEMTGALERERATTEQFLTLDERNFHCWNYRRFVVSKMVGDGEGGESFKRAFGDQIAALPPTSPMSVLTATNTSFREVILGEFEFTSNKIDINFSNYSAFHYRSKLLPIVLDLKMGEEQRAGKEGTAASRDLVKIRIAKEELALCQNAIFTEPDDQSSWFYHRFVIDWAGVPGAVGGLKNEAVRAYVEMLQDETVPLREIIEEEKAENKWSLMALHDILMRMDRLVGDLKEDANQLLELLRVIDPAKSARYRNA